MENRAAYLRVGLLLIAGAAAIVGLVFFLSGGQVRKGVHYETYFQESVQGLEIGAPVKYLGVTLGQVTELGLVSAAYAADADVTADVRRSAARQVFVRFVIDPTRLGRVPDTETAVRQGLRVRLASQGITGLAYLELDFVDPVKFPVQAISWQPRDSYLPSMPSTITQVQDAAQALLDKLGRVDIDKLSTSAQQVLDDLHGELSGGDAHTALAEAAGLLKSLHAAVDGADIPGLAADLRATSDSIRGTVGGKDTKDLLASTTQAADRLSAAAARLPALIAALETTVRRANAGTGDIQAELAPVLRDAQAAAANLRETSDTLRRYPASVLLGAPPPHTEPTR